MIEVLGIPKSWAIAIMGVFVASFAGTSLDTATRIQRYVTSELFTRIRVRIFNNIYLGTAFAVGTAAVLAFSDGADGKGALTLWPLFGAINQSLASLALIIIAIYLKQKGGLRWLVTFIPFVFMIIMTLWAVVLNELNLIGSHKWLLATMNACILAIVVTIAVEGTLKLIRMSR